MDCCMRMMLQMQMSLYWGQDAIILFSGWPGDSLSMYLVALLLVFLLAVAVEFLSALPLAKPGSSHVVCALRQSTVYSLRMGLAYLVMLSVMSFNLGVLIVAVGGHGIGSFMVNSRAIRAANGTARSDPSNAVSV